MDCPLAGTGRPSRAGRSPSRRTGLTLGANGARPAWSRSGCPAARPRILWMTYHVTTSARGRQDERCGAPALRRTAERRRTCSASPVGPEGLTHARDDAPDLDLQVRAGALALGATLPQAPGPMSRSLPDYPGWVRTLPWCDRAARSGYLFRTGGRASRPPTSDHARVVRSTGPSQQTRPCLPHPFAQSPNMEHLVPPKGYCGLGKSPRAR